MSFPRFGRAFLMGCVHEHIVVFLQTFYIFPPFQEKFHSVMQTKLNKLPLSSTATRSFKKKGVFLGEIFYLKELCSAILLQVFEQADCP